MKKSIISVNDKYWRLTAIKFVYKNKKSRQFWLFNCDCGNKKIICVNDVKNGHTKSCGCLCKETSKKTLISYGLTIKNGEYVLCHICKRKIYRTRQSIEKNKKGIFICSEKCRKKAYKDKILNHKGGDYPHKHSAGYIQFYAPEHPRADNHGYAMEHTLKMEEKIGRFLNKKEVVHHINEKKDDNKIKNLLLCKNMSEHMKLHCIHRKKKMYKNLE